MIATTDRLGDKARRTLETQREPVGYLLRSQLELAHVAWPASPDDLRRARPARKRPDPHVKEAVGATVRKFQQTDRGQLVMACGTGKTLAGLWITERLAADRTLVLVPSLSLLAQTLREWTANASEPFEYIAVCSDPTVVGEDDDQLVQHTSELGLPVTTDPGAIARFLRGRRRRVVFATYQSSPRIAAAYGKRTPSLHLAIADEAHRCAGRSARDFATILHSQRIHARRRLFMTATPRYYGAPIRREAEQRDVEVASMDDDAVFGPVLHSLPFGAAIDQGLLSDYQVVVVRVGDETYREWAERGELVTRDGRTITDARTLAGQIALARAMRRHHLRRVISFHSRVPAARAFSEETRGVFAWLPARARPSGLLWSEHVNGAMPSGQRDRLLLRFGDLAPRERGLLTNARCLAEGVNVPTIDGVAFIDPRRSDLDIIQAVGRAIRKAPNKRVGTIVLPVFVSDEDAEQVLDDSAFKNVWDVLKALRAHDETLGEELDELRLSLGLRRRSAPRRPGKIKLELDLPRSIGSDFARAFDVLLVEATTASWWEMLGRLRAYVDEHGSLPKTIGDPIDPKLGDWTRHQRRDFRQGTLDPRRSARLRTEVPEGHWEDSREDAAWENGFDHYRRAVAILGHGDVEQQLRDPSDDYPTGRWVNHQRTGRDRLRDDLRSRLEADPDWQWTSDRRIRELKAFVEENGHTYLPAHVPGRWKALARWMGRTRQRYKRDPSSLAREIVEALDAIPEWQWDISEARSFRDDRFSASA